MHNLTALSLNIFSSVKHMSIQSTKLMRLCIDGFNGLPVDAMVSLLAQCSNLTDISLSHTFEVTKIIHYKILHAVAEHCPGLTRLVYLGGTWHNSSETISGCILVLSQKCPLLTELRFTHILAGVLNTVLTNLPYLTIFETPSSEGVGSVPLTESLHSKKCLEQVNIPYLRDEDLVALGLFCPNLKTVHLVGTSLVGITHAGYCDTFKKLCQCYEI